VVEVVYYVATSLDGYIATPDGGIGWLFPFEGAVEDYGYARFYESVDAILVGRRTFEQARMFAEWPYPGKPCWVFSGRHISVAQPEVIVTSQTPVQAMSEFSVRDLRRVWLVGGAALAASFRADGLITEYIISIIPVILGAGIPLFAASGPVERVQLAESTPYPNGVIRLRYKRLPMPA
jgi:dihydrofolate reductase